MKQVMVDLETMAVSPNAVIASIGSCHFDIETSEIGDEYHAVVDMQTCADVGLVFNGPTVKWWLCQDDEARANITDEPISINQALHGFREFLPSEFVLWSDSTFDAVILESAYRAIKQPAPWHYHHTRDIRTLRSMWSAASGEVQSKASLRWVEESAKYRTATQRATRVHHALDDSIRQAAYCSMMWRELMANQKQSSRLEIK